jgi:hypothetical protein
MTKEEFTEKFCIDGKWQKIKCSSADCVTPCVLSPHFDENMFIDTDTYQWNINLGWELYEEPKEDVSLNYSEGKLKPSLILKDMQLSFLELLKQRSYGCEKYSRDNLFKSIGTEHEEAFLEDNLDSIQRHLNEEYAGNHIDDESNTYHLAAVALRALIGLEYLLRRAK